MKEIKLTQGKVALVDDEDYEHLSRFKWYASRAKNNFYATRRGRPGLGEKRTTIFMHRIIIGTPENLDTDHEDGNTLNNQRYNLRSCTRAENDHNRRGYKANVSGYKGVTRSRRLHNPWRATIKFKNKTTPLGNYKTKEEAALAYNEKASELFGKFAYLNKIRIIYSAK